ncbi:MAG TPA: GDCCVxC domain-containing (seleno)protein [Nitrospirales bacterium]|nr:GDCCVxC domain-containing (seleno)protein [Nitrospirales bacterium]
MGINTQLQSTLRCPHCGFQKTESMSVDSCQVRYECQKCRTILRPKPEDCCVFCSYGTVSCPPQQEKHLGK